jgi:hypothetical protein
MHKVLQVVNIKFAIFWDFTICDFVELANVFMEPADSTSKGGRP